MNTVKLTQDNFEQEVFLSDKTVLVDFWAPWCGPCRAVAPIVDEVARENSNAKIGKVNIDEEPALAEAFGVMSIPTLMVFKNGKAVNKAVGLRPKSEIAAMLKA